MRVSTAYFSLKTICHAELVSITGAAFSAKREVCKILNTHDYHCAPNLTLQDDRSCLLKNTIIEI